MDFLEWSCVWISIKILLKFVPRVPIYNIPALVQIMAGRQPGDKPLPEPLMVSFLMHIYVIRPQWVNTHECFQSQWHSPIRSLGIVAAIRVYQWNIQTKINCKVVVLWSKSHRTLSQGFQLRMYRQTYDISRTLEVKKLADHSDVVGARSVGVTPTTFSFSA